LILTYQYYGKKRATTAITKVSPVAFSRSMHNIMSVRAANLAHASRDNDKIMKTPILNKPLTIPMPLAIHLSDDSGTPDTRLPE